MINKVILVGILGVDPQIKFSQNGVMVAIMKLATTEYIKKNGSLSPITEWHTIYAYGKLAEFCNVFKKGDKIFVEGKLRKVSFEVDNKVFRVSNIIAKSVKLVSRRPSGDAHVVEMTHGDVGFNGSSADNRNISSYEDFLLEREKTGEIPVPEEELSSQDSDLF